MEPMLELFYFETSQYLSQLEQSVLNGEKSGCFSEDTINEVFRIMHNIKSSAAMMLFANISTLAHAMEDLFFFLREEQPKNIDYSTLSDLVLAGADFIKVELEKAKNGDEVDGDNTILIKDIKKFLAELKQNNTFVKPNISDEKEPLNNFKVTVFFEKGCEMENVRAYLLVHQLEEIAQEIYYIPEDILENEDSAEVIKEQGFKIWFKADFTYEKMEDLFDHSAFVQDLELVLLENDNELKQFIKAKKDPNEDQKPNMKKEIIPGKSEQRARSPLSNGHQSIISVNVNKLDMLMDLVGEMVIAEDMVIQNPDLKDLELDNFRKAARQLQKITDEVQDIVMSIRMVPLTVTFQKMNRIVRDMCKKLNKDVALEIIGQETEVDKTIIEQISDPLMHLVRNAVDHGLESNEERNKIGKTEPAKVTIEAKNAGSDVLVMVKDNGKGLDKEKILQRARENQLLKKPESEMTDREIFNLIFSPGFTTKEKASEFSGRGVGMDVVVKNIENVGGTVQIDSTPHEGTTITMKIPLTLAIIDGMNIRVGKSRYIIPITAIKQSFRPKEREIITDPDKNEMIMVRGACYPILRLHEIFRVKTAITKLSDGILIIIENDDKSLCLFADAILGQQQVVVKALPAYIRKIKGLAGCTLLGDGSISMILDIASFFNTQS